MKILQFPDPALFTLCTLVETFDQDLENLLDQMYETMLTANGLGLSANQVGQTIRAFTMKDDQGQRWNVINPVILDQSQIPAMLKEGCLSAPGDFVILKDRPLWVRIIFSNEKGYVLDKVFQGIAAVCVMHEIDHLNGLSHLQSPSLNRAQRKAFAKKWNFTP